MLGHFPILSKFAMNILTVLAAAAADCERTLGEFGDILGTRRLRTEPELISDWQGLKSWRRLDK